MKRNPLAAALLAVLVLAPCLAFAGEWKDGQAIVTPYGQPGATSDGSAYRVNRGDSDGNPYVRSWAPTFELVEQKMGVTILSAASDSSMIPVASSAYRQMFLLIRLKTASFAAAAALEIGARGHLIAGADSTQRGFFFTMGNGISNGRTKYLVTLGDRWFTVPLADSATGQPFTFPYVGHYVTNRTGATVTADIQLWGIRW